MTPQQVRGPGAGGDDAWQLHKQLARSRRDRLGRTTPVPAPELVDASLALARCAAALDARDEVVEGLGDAARWSAAAFAAAERDLFHAVPRSAETAPNLPLAAPLALGGLCAAMLLRDAPSLAVLAAPGAFERNWARSATGDMAVGHESFWPIYGGFFAALVRGETIEPSRIQACRAAVLSDEPSALDRAGLRALKLPPIRLVDTLTNQPEGWIVAVGDALHAFNSFFSDPDWMPMETGMLALDISALCAIAHDRYGAPSDYGSPFIPAWLVGGRAATPE
jgi:hypothetical protein